MRGKFLKNRKMQYIASFIACILVVHCAGLVAKADGVDMELVYRGYTAESGGLDKASQELKTTGDTILEIAQRTGFDNISNFFKIIPFYASFQAM